MCSSICRSESALSPLMQRLMQLTQQGLPLHEKPYLQLARQLGVSEQEVLDSLQQMQDPRRERTQQLPARLYLYE